MHVCMYACVRHRARAVSVAQAGELGLTRCELGRTRCELGLTRCELGRTRCELGLTRCELGRTRCELGRTRCELGRTRCELRLMLVSELVGLGEWFAPALMLSSPRRGE